MKVKFGKINFQERIFSGTSETRITVKTGSICAFNAFTIFYNNNKILLGTLKWSDSSSDREQNDYFYFAKLSWKFWKRVKNYDTDVCLTRVQKKNRDSIHWYDICFTTSSRNVIEKIIRNVRRIRYNRARRIDSDSFSFIEKKKKNFNEYVLKRKKKRKS